MSVGKTKFYAMKLACLTTGMLPGAADFVYQEMKKMVVSFIGGMM